MRIGSLSLAAILALALSGCSDSSEDPLAAKCKSVCNISDSHPCYDDGKGEDECVKACRTLIGAVDKNPTYMQGCAECLADQFEYAIKPDTGCSETSGGVACCYPGYVIQPVPNDPQSAGWTACEAKCIEPDGGVGY